MLSRIVVSLAFMLGMSFSAVAEEKVVRLASLEWACHTPVRHSRIKGDYRSSASCLCSHGI